MQIIILIINHKSGKRSVFFSKKNCDGDQNRDNLVRHCDCIWYMASLVRFNEDVGYCNTTSSRSFDSIPTDSATTTFFRISPLLDENDQALLEGCRKGCFRIEQEQVSPQFVFEKLSKDNYTELFLQEYKGWKAAKKKQDDADERGEATALRVGSLWYNCILSRD
jgi:hypothetical protein